MCIARAFVIGGFASLAAATSTFAIEPHPPQQLITTEEAIVIQARQHLDSLTPSSDKGIAADRTYLSAYYANHEGAPLWVTSNGLTEKAKRIADEIRKADEWGLDSQDFILPKSGEDFSASSLVRKEVAMSLAILKYARHARGGRINPKDLSLAIDRTPPLEDAHVVLDTLQTSADPAAYLKNLHPQHAQFKKLRLAYIKILGDQNKYVPLSGTQDPGAADKKKKAKLKNSNAKTAQRLLYNMEMWRWMPRDLGTKYVWSNVPEFKVRVIKNERIIHEERIVAGKVSKKTPIFSDEMETIVFHPFWGVPNSIKVKEIFPSLIRGGDILARQNLKISYAGRVIDPQSVDWSQQDIRNYHVFQPPGRSNALGVVKFMFPNKHAVYMHDTPSKQLFKHNVRAYSHGCMRVRNPLKLAEVILSHDKGWTRSKIDALIAKGPKNNQIALSNKILVHVTYFTAHINDAGKPVFVKDIYGHEKRIQMGLDGKAHLIVKKKVNLDAARVAALSNASSYYKKQDPDWMQRVFEN